LLLMKKSVRLMLVVFALSAIATYSCKEKEPTPEPTAKLNFYFSVDDAKKQVAFTPMINFGDNFRWDFGDGNTSNEKNPVHVYAVGGTYDVKLSVTGRGETKEITKEVPLALSNLQMLAGDNKFPNGKKWRLSINHSTTDRFALADANLSVYNGVYLSAGILGMGLGLSEVYEDEYVFKNDGSFQHIPVHGGSFASTLYAAVNGHSVIKLASEKDYEFLCYAAFTPEQNATYTFAENQDFSLATAYGPVTYRNVMTLDFSGKEFIGFMDYTRKCIVLSLRPESMQLAIFASLAGPGIQPPTHALILTFEVVR